jgi:hypothetical protein
VAEGLPNKLKALSSNPNTAKQTNGGRKKKRKTEIGPLSGEKCAASEVGYPKTSR